MEQCKIWKFGDNVDTDQIIASQYLLLPTIDEMKQYTFESLDNSFAENCRPGEAVVGGTNFGCGSSREQAPAVLKALGIKAIIARSFARIFFRNSINIGLPLIICDALYPVVDTGDTIGLSYSEGSIKAKNTVCRFNKFPAHVMQIIDAGGLIESINRIEG